MLRLSQRGIIVISLAHRCEGGVLISAEKGKKGTQARAANLTQPSDTSSYSSLRT